MKRLVRFLKKYSLFFSIIFSGILLYYSLYKINWIKFQEIFFTLSPLLILQIICWSIFARFIIAYRWYLLLLISEKARFQLIWDFTNIGYFINNIFPARLGDVVKSIMWSKAENQSKSKAIASVGMERIFDMLGLSFVFISILLIQDIAYEYRIAGSILTLIVLLILLLLFLLPKTLLKILLKYKKSKNKTILWIFSKIELVLNYFAQLKDLKSGILFILTTLTIWFLYVLIGYLIARIMVPEHLAWHASLLSLLIVGLSFILPTTPGNIGVYQFACVIAFGILNIDKATAIAYSIISQLSVYFLSLLLGFISLWNRGINLKSLHKQSNSDQMKQNQAKTKGNT